jgi:hypothetical protein
VPGAPYLNAVTMGGDGFRGVAVGQAKTSPAGSPKILYTDNNDEWKDPTSIDWDGEQSTYLGKDLREVAWANDSSSEEYWAVGELGLVLHTENGGVDWERIEPNVSGVSDYQDLNLHSVDFVSPAVGIFVGRNDDTDEAIALRYKVSTDTWTDISPSFSTYALDVLSDVSIFGSKAYAVGQTKPASGDREGRAMISTGSAFVAVSGLSAIPECKVGEAPLGVSVLNEIEAVTHNDIWIGGQCGQVWHYDGSAWTKIKSQTSSHVRGLACPSADTCYVATHRASNLHSTVTRMQ